MESITGFWKKYGRLVSIVAVIALLCCWRGLHGTRLDNVPFSGVAPVGFLSQGSLVRQDFTVKDGNLNRIEVCFATYLRDNTGSIEVKLTETESGNVIFKETLSGREIIDNAKRGFDFPRQPDSDRRHYSLEIAGLDGNADNSVTAYIADTVPGMAEVQVNGRPVPGKSLYILSSCSPGLAGWFAPFVMTLGSFFLLLWLWDALCGRKKSAAAAGPGGKRAEFDWGLHYFRGFAIANIVAGHVLVFMGYETLVNALFLVDTIYFLFISGYLCRYLAGDHFCAWSYYRKKIVNIILPYIALSLLTIYAVSCYGSEPGMLFYGEINWRSVMNALLIGKAQSAYWYISFVTLLFLVSPLILKLSPVRLLQLTCVTALLPLLLPSRGWWGHSRFDVMLAYTYFSWTYLLGFTYCVYREKCDRFLRAVWPALLLGGVLIFLVVYNIDKLGLTPPLATLANYQKVLFTGCVVLLLQKIKVKIAILDLLARYSFTIYFLHMFFIGDLLRFRAVLEKCVGSIPVLTPLLLTVCYILAMLGFSLLLKTALGKKSRYLIGV